MKPLPAKSVLDATFTYDEVTGKLFWKNRTNGRRRNDEAGGKTGKGYLVVIVDGSYYFAHRVIWKMIHGVDPVAQIDHRNNIKNDNRRSNLREATQEQNQHNTVKRRDNASGIKGVSWHSRDKTWRAYIMVNGKLMHLGYHDNIDLAELVVSEARRRYHSDFARAA